MKLKKLTKKALLGVLVAGFIMSVSTLAKAYDAEIVKQLNTTVTYSDGNDASSENLGKEVKVTIYPNDSNINTEIHSMANALVDKVYISGTEGNEKLRITFKEVVFKPVANVGELPSYIDRIVYSTEFKPIKIKDDTKYKTPIADATKISMYNVSDSSQFASYVNYNGTHIDDVTGLDTFGYKGIKERTVEIPVKTVTDKFNNTYKRCYLAFEVPAMYQAIKPNVKKSAVLVVE